MSSSAFSGIFPDALPTRPDVRVVPLSVAIREIRSNLVMTSMQLDGVVSFLIAVFFALLFYTTWRRERGSQDNEVLARRAFGLLGAGFFLLLFTACSVGSVLAATIWANPAVQQPKIQDADYLVIAVPLLAIAFLLVRQVWLRWRGRSHSSQH